MAKYTTVSLSHKTKGRFELAKEKYYGEEIADQISHDRFVEDVCDDVLNDRME